MISIAPGDTNNATGRFQIQKNKRKYDQVILFHFISPFAKWKAVSFSWDFYPISEVDSIIPYYWLCFKYEESTLYMLSMSVELKAKRSYLLKRYDKIWRTDNNKDQREYESTCSEFVIQQEFVLSKLANGCHWNGSGALFFDMGKWCQYRVQTQPSNLMTTLKPQVNLHWSLKGLSK